MLESISYFPLFGKPVIMYLGILTLASFFVTATIGFLNYRGDHRIPFRWHPRMAAVSLGLALVHGFLAIMHYV